MDKIRNIMTEPWGVLFSALPIQPVEIVGLRGDCSNLSAPKDVEKFSEKYLASWLKYFSENLELILKDI